MNTRHTDWQSKTATLMTPWAKDVSQHNALPEYPRPQLVRDRWLSLNGLWEFDVAEDLDTVPVGKTLPRDILVPFPVESALSGIMERTNYAWYRLKFHIPREWHNQRILLHFGAVDWEARVYVNGNEAGVHRGGYNPFTLDITDALVPDSEQELIVGVFDPSDTGGQPRGKQVNEPGSIWYTSITGIWQTVWLEPVPDTYIESINMVPDVDAQCLRFKARINKDSKVRRVRATVTAAGKSISQTSDLASQDLVLPVPEAKLWSPDSPFLYDLEVSLLDDNENVIDSVASYFGMRKVAIGQDEQGISRIMLNGEFVFQAGLLDQGYWPDGLYTAPTDDALRYDIQTTKELGFNLSRKHAKVEPQRWYYWCDRIGLLVWQDMPSGDNTSAADHSQFELEMSRMIDDLHNHPCIIKWVIFNEAWGQFDDQRVTQSVMDMDPHRIVSNVSGWHDRGIGDIIDMHCYPGPGWVEAEPDRAAVIGEYGGPRLRIKEHSWSAEADWGYFDLSSKEELTACYEKMLKNIWQKVDNPGISAVVFTQLTDVEIECNGLLTYDRKEIKVDLDRIVAANKGKYDSLGQFNVLEPTSQRNKTSWNYTFDDPGSNWSAPDFDDSRWKRGIAGFGTEQARQATVNTLWTSNNIWLRRSFDLNANVAQDLFLLVHHHNDTEIYINGIPALSVEGFRLYYEEYPVDNAVLAALKPTGNIIAIKSQGTGKDQYIDAGVIGLRL